MKIFISSVQNELAEERRAVKTFIESDPLLRRFFTAFLFEDIPASDRRTDAVYIAEVDRSAVYLGIFGYEYGFEDAEGVSPTEREFDQATETGIPRLIFVKGADDQNRKPKMLSLIRKAGQQLIRRRFADIPELTAAFYSSLVDHLEGCGAIQSRPFEERPCSDAALEDIDLHSVTNFLRLARMERQFPLPDNIDVADGQVKVKVNGVDVFHPNTGEVRSDGAEGIACWFIDTDYNEESFFVRHAYFLGANDPYKSLKTTLKAEINEDAWASLNSDTSRPFDKPKTGRIAVKVINHLGDEVMKVFRVTP